MTKTTELSPGEQQFVEAMGLYFEGFGIPRTSGRILALLMVAERPLTLDDMARALKVSRASVSTNARMSVASGMAEHVSLPGDRRDYYQLSPSAWEQRFRVGIPALEALRRLADQGLAAIDRANALGRERLTEMRDACEFMQEELLTSLERWRERQAQRGLSKARALDGTSVPSTPT